MFERVGVQALVDTYSCTGSGGSFVRVLRFVNAKVFASCGLIANSSLKTGGFAIGFVYVGRCPMDHSWLVELKVRPVTREVYGSYWGAEAMSAKALKTSSLLFMECEREPPHMSP